MSDVTVIGLGDLGSVLAKTLLSNGYSVTVWNRTGDKAKSVVEAGAKLAPNPASAISASPVVITCVADYKVTRSILETKDAVSALAGKVLIELSTGTPQEARDAESWAREQGAKYLDGAVLATPSQIGRPDTPIFISGVKTAFEKSEAILKTLGGGLQYTGEAIGGASAWDFALLSYAFGGMIGFFHGARIFEAEGFRVDDLGAAITGFAPISGEMVKHASGIIQSESYDKPQSSVNICVAAMEMIIRQAQEAGINSEIPALYQRLFKKAQSAGYGNEESAALIKVLRNNS